jgi:hypothetical protein
MEDLSKIKADIVLEKSHGQLTEPPLASIYKKFYKSVSGEGIRANIAYTKRCPLQTGVLQMLIVIMLYLHPDLVLYRTFEGTLISHSNTYVASTKLTRMVF